jgi:type VI protein secretion system component VasF
MMKHQDARYIPQRRMDDQQLRDRFPIWRFALAVAAMLVVALIVFQLFCRYA